MHGANIKRRYILKHTTTSLQTIVLPTFRPFQWTSWYNFKLARFRVLDSEYGQPSQWGYRTRTNLESHCAPGQELGYFISQWFGSQSCGPMKRTPVNTSPLLSSSLIAFSTQDDLG